MREQVEPNTWYLFVEGFRTHMLGACHFKVGPRGQVSKPKLPAFSRRTEAKGSASNLI